MSTFVKLRRFKIHVYQKTYRIEALVLVLERHDDVETMSTGIYVKNGTLI